MGKYVQCQFLAQAQLGHFGQFLKNNQNSEMPVAVKYYRVVQRTAPYVAIQSRKMRLSNWTAMQLQ